MLHEIAPSAVRAIRLASAIFVLVVSSATFACVIPRPPVAVGLTPKVAIKVRLPTGVLADLKLERYIVGSITAEADFRGIEPIAAGRMARVQAILTRTYALANRNRHRREGFDLCSTTHCQVYNPTVGSNSWVRTLAQKAARTTAGLVIMYNDRPINAVYHANCGGHTSDATVPWGGVTPPYLRGVNDTFCALKDTSPWRFEASLTALETALAADALTRVVSLRIIRVMTYDDAGRAVEVAIEGQDRRVVSGEKLRSVLAEHFGYRSIASTLFRLSVSDNAIIFKGRGFGHGVGLCQRGTRARAQGGHTTNAILSHYYPGTVVKRYY